MLGIVLLSISYIVGVVCRVVDRAVHLSKTPNNDVSGVGMYFNKNKALILTRSITGALLLTATVYGSVLTVPASILFGFAGGYAFEGAVDSIQKHIQRFRNGPTHEG